MGPNTLSSPQKTPRTNYPLPNAEPWDPNRVFGFIAVISVIGVGIALGLNWKRLGKPEWAQKTIVASILLPLVSIVLALAWVSSLIQAERAPFQMVMSVPLLALGINFGYIWALARLQNGAYKKWQQEGRDAMLVHAYDVNAAIRFGVAVAVVIVFIGVFIFPLFT